MSFRPLIGVSFCKHTTQTRTEAATGRFRPLIGVSFCKLVSLFSVLKNSYDCFRPLIGVSFCKRITSGRIVRHYDKYCFRPLIGVSFCKLKEFDKDSNHGIIVSVPLSGLVFVNYPHIGEKVICRKKFPSPYRG